MRYTVMRSLLTSLFFILILLSFFTGTGVCADTSSKSAVKSRDTEDDLALRRTMLQRESDALAKLKQDVNAQKKTRDKELIGLQKQTVTGAVLEETRLAMEAARVNVASAKLDLAGEQQRIKTFQAQFADMQDQLVVLQGRKDSEDRVAALQAKLKRLQVIITLEQQYEKILSRHLYLLQEKADMAASWWQSVQAVFQRQELLRHRESLEDMKRRLEQEEKKARSASARLEKELALLKPDTPDSAARRQLLKRQLESIDESLNILRTRIKLQAIKSRHDSLGLTELTDAQPEKLKTDLGVLRDIDNQLVPLLSVTTGKLDVLRQQWALLQKQYALKNISGSLFSREKKILTGLIDDFSPLLNSMKAFKVLIQQDIQRVKSAYARSVQQSLTARQTLPGDIAAWKNMFEEFAGLPERLEQVFTGTTSRIIIGWQQADTGRRMFFAWLVSALVAAVLFLGRLPGLKTSVEKVPSSMELRFSARVRFTACALLRESRAAVLIGGVLLVAAWMFNVEPIQFSILLLFIIVLFALQLTIKLSYLLFVSELNPPAQRQPRLHHMIVGVAAFSAVFALFMGLGNIGFLSTTIREVIDRFFMVLLLLSVYFFMRLRALLTARLSLNHKKKFWVRVVKLASLSIPLTALCAAIVGLAGYINLARFVAGQLVLFLAVAIAWLLLRDLLRDLIRGWKLGIDNMAIKQDASGTSIVASLERLLDLMLFAGAFWCLARIYGWDTGNAVDTFLKSRLYYPLFHLGQQAITLINIVISLFLLLFFLHLSSLARHITYLLMHRNVGDKGFRNSLSIFIQYIVFIIGAMIVLNSLGLNLTSLTVFAGALGVGIGFGLQNIANNLISGLILLAERPVRVEDWISIGDNQGTISRIGMRSLVLKTWDNQDVIIPNADLITSPVTNWTLSDNLIRTILQVGIRYQDDPHRAKKIILDAVSMVPEVSLQKKPKIYLVEFADSSVNFRIDFYSELDSQHGRLGVKSSVMFAIWDALKDADIGIPFPQQDIYIKELPRKTPQNAMSEKESAVGMEKGTSDQGLAGTAT